MKHDRFVRLTRLNININTVKELILITESFKHTELLSGFQTSVSCHCDVFLFFFLFESNRRKQHNLYLPSIKVQCVSDCSSTSQPPEQQQSQVSKATAGVTLSSMSFCQWLNPESFHRFNSNIRNVSVCNFLSLLINLPLNLKCFCGLFYIFFYSLASGSVLLFESLYISCKLFLTFIISVFKTYLVLF